MSEAVGGEVTVADDSVQHLEAQHQLIITQGLVGEHAGLSGNKDQKYLCVLMFKCFTLKIKIGI